MSRKQKPLVPDERFGKVDPSVGQRRDVIGPMDMGVGVLLTNRNARRLMSDAVTLAEQGSFATAMALGILAQEEAGKVQVITFLAAVGKRPGGTRLWKMFESHRPKGELPVKAHAMTHDARNPGKTWKFRPEDWVETLDRWKERALYVESVHTPTRWSVPSAVFEHDGCILLLGSILETMRITLMTGWRAATILPVSNWAKHDEGRRACAAIAAWGRTKKARAIHDCDEAEHREWYEGMKKRLDALATGIEGWKMGIGVPDAVAQSK